nr:hypothetical protein [Tanacetum cinerariifolium]
MSGSEDEDTILHVVSAPLSSDRVPASFGYLLDSDSDSNSESTKDDSSDEYLMKTVESPQTYTALTLFIQTPFIRLSPSGTSPSSPAPSLLPSSSHQEGAPSTFDIGKSSADHVLLVTRESVNHTIPLLAARLIHHQALIDEVRDHMREDSFVTDERIKTLQARLTSVEHWSTEFLDSQDADRLKMAELRNCSQRVTNAMETISIYETKIRVAYDLIVRVIRQGATVARNANNKRKQERGYQDNLGQQNKRQKDVKVYTAGPDNKKGYVGSLPMCK